MTEIKTAAAKSSVTVRPLRKEDRTAIEGLLKSAGIFRSGEIACALEIADESLSGGGSDEDYAVLCAEYARGDIIGFVCYGKTPLTRATWDIYWIVTDPSRRRGGVGRQMLRRVESILRERGAKIVVAETSSLPAYEHARAFYEREGFRQESRIGDFYAEGDDRIIYCKRF